jgi:hypothetical protein
MSDRCGDGWNAAALLLGSNVVMTSRGTATSVS